MNACKPQRTKVSTFKGLEVSAAGDNKVTVKMIQVAAAKGGSTSY